MKKMGAGSPSRRQKKMGIFEATKQGQCVKRPPRRVHVECACMEGLSGVLQMSGARVLC